MSTSERRNSCPVAVRCIGGPPGTMNFPPGSSDSASLLASQGMSRRQPYTMLPGPAVHGAVPSCQAHKASNRLSAITFPGRDRQGPDLGDALLLYSKNASRLSRW